MRIANRRKFTDQFKAKIALEALRGDKAMQEIAAKHQVHPNQVSTWKRQAVEGMGDVFARGGKPDGPTEAEIKALQAKIGASFCPPLVRGQWRAAVGNEAPMGFRGPTGATVPFPMSEGLKR